MHFATTTTTTVSSGALGLVQSADVAFALYFAYYEFVRSACIVWCSLLLYYIYTLGMLLGICMYVCMHACVVSRREICDHGRAFRFHHIHDIYLLMHANAVPKI